MANNGDNVAGRASNSGEESGAEPADARGSGADGPASGGEHEAPDAPESRDQPGNAGDPEAALQAALRSLGNEELTVWQRQLQAAGFSEAEAAKLIFERIRPREEGRTRTS